MLDGSGVLPFTGWELNRSQPCLCGATHPAGTVWRWIPWLDQWRCPDCAEECAKEYDTRMAGRASRAVAFVPRIPETRSYYADWPEKTPQPTKQDVTAMAMMSERNTGVEEFERYTRPQHTANVGGAMAVQRGLWG